MSSDLNNPPTSAADQTPELGNPGQGRQSTTAHCDGRDGGKHRPPHSNAVIVSATAADLPEPTSIQPNPTDERVVEAIQPSLNADPTVINTKETRRLYRLNWLGRLVDRRRMPALLVSLIVHTALFLLLAIWTISKRAADTERFDFQAALAQPADNDATELILATGQTAAPPADDLSRQLEPPRPAAAVNTAQVSRLLSRDSHQREQHAALDELEHLFNASGTSLSAAFVSTGIDGRQLQQREQVALARGGTIASEKAVEAALVWLAAHQQPSGAWSLVHDGGICAGRCRDNGCQDRFDAAATGLALLAFMGAGYTHRDGQHRDTVRKGVYFLLQILEETPQGASLLYQSDRGMYNHGIAAFALCEAYQLTGDEDLKQPAQQTVDFIIAAQNYGGGWGYLPKKPGDLTLSGWQVMALKSASAAGLETPPAAIWRISPFLDSQMVESGFTYGYREPGASTTCTAIGMLLRLFLGKSHTDSNLLDGAAFLHQQGPAENDVYFNYYATLALFHMGGSFWEQWHPRVRDHLVSTQATSGHEAGSWYFPNPYGKEGGRLYTTAMAAMTLEVYYRFSPIYQQADTPFEL